MGRRLWAVPGLNAFFLAWTLRLNIFEDIFEYLQDDPRWHRRAEIDLFRFISDFDSWVKLLQKSETCDAVSEVVQAYDVFLERYPLCFGYWKKYSDILKKRNHSNEDILKVSFSILIYKFWYRWVVELKYFLLQVFYEVFAKGRSIWCKMKQFSLFSVSLWN